MRTLSITIDDKLYDRLKRSIPQRQISKFVSHAIEESFEEGNQTLYRAYVEAANDRVRENVIKEWEFSSKAV